MLFELFHIAVAVYPRGGVLKCCDRFAQSDIKVFECHDRYAFSLESECNAVPYLGDMSS